MTWLRKRGHAKDDDDTSNDAPERTFAEVLAQVCRFERVAWRIVAPLVLTRRRTSE